MQCPSSPALLSDLGRTLPSAGGRARPLPAQHRTMWDRGGGGQVGLVLTGGLLVWAPPERRGWTGGHAWRGHVCAFRHEWPLGGAQLVLRGVSRRVTWIT